MRARGVTQKEIAERTGWSPGQLNRVVVGVTRLTQSRAATLARLLDCPQSILFGAMGEPIPRPARPDRPEGVAERLSALATLLGTDWQSLLRFVLAGDFGGFPALLAERLRLILEERQN